MARKSKARSDDEGEDSAEPDALFVEMGRRIRAARMAKNLIVDDVSEAIGVSKGWIYGVELGRQNFQIFLFRRLLTFLGLELRDVFALESEVSERVPSPRLNAMASKTAAQLATASKALNDARELLSQMQALTEPDASHTPQERRTHALIIPIQEPLTTPKPT